MFHQFFLWIKNLFISSASAGASSSLMYFFACRIAFLTLFFSYDSTRWTAKDLTVCSLAYWLEVVFIMTEQMSQNCMISLDPAILGTKTARELEKLLT
jgi:hypothetical protein